MNHQKPQDIVRVGSSLFVLSTQAKVGTDLKSNVKQYLQGKKTGFYESFDDWKFLKTNIYELVEEEDFFRCSCGEGLKKYFCKHNIAMSIKFKGLEILDTAKSVPLTENRRRGRPKKNKGWWSHV